MSNCNVHGVGFAEPDKPAQPIQVDKLTTAEIYDCTTKQWAQLVSNNMDRGIRISATNSILAIVDADIELLERHIDKIRAKEDKAWVVIYGQLAGLLQSKLKSKRAKRERYLKELVEVLQ